MYSLNLSAQFHYLHGTVQPHNPTIQNPYCLANPPPPPFNQRISWPVPTCDITLLSSRWTDQSPRNLGTWSINSVPQVYNLHLKYTLCNWSSQSAPEVYTLQLKYIICTWSINSASDVHTLHLKCTICIWSINSAPEVNTLHLTYTHYTWSAQSAPEV